MKQRLTLVSTTDLADELLSDKEWVSNVARNKEKTEHEIRELVIEFCTGLRLKEMLSDKEFVSILVETTTHSSWVGQLGTTKNVLTDSASVEQVYENLVKNRNEAELKVLQLRDVIKLIKPLCQWISSRTYRWMVWALFAFFVVELFCCVYGSLCGAHWYECLADVLYVVGILVFARALHLYRKNISFVQEVINKVDE